eukprot:Polyplicarium_translucidae@DN2782_c0_g2_i3.p3
MAPPPAVAACTATFIHFSVGQKHAHLPRTAVGGVVPIAASFAFALRRRLAGSSLGVLNAHGFDWVPVCVSSTSRPIPPPSIAKADTGLTGAAPDASRFDNFLFLYFGTDTRNGLA